jgi:hypothetical protein
VYRGGGIYRDFLLSECSSEEGIGFPAEDLNVCLNCQRGGGFPLGENILCSIIDKAKVIKRRSISLFKFGCLFLNFSDESWMGSIIGRYCIMTCWFWAVSLDEDQRSMVICGRGVCKNGGGQVGKK